MSDTILSPTIERNDPKAETFLIYLSPFANSMKEASQDERAFKEISLIGRIAWNLSFLDRKAQSKQLDRATETILKYRLETGLPEKAVSEIKRILFLLVKRRKNFYKREKWLITGLELTSDRGDCHVTITTTDDLDRAKDESAFKI